MENVLLVYKYTYVKATQAIDTHNIIYICVYRIYSTTQKKASDRRNNVSRYA